MALSLLRDLSRITCFLSGKLDTRDYELREHAPLPMKIFFNLFLFALLF